jgi:hypothetical protein
VSLPPIERIQQALRNVTERLPLQLDPQAPAPQWTDLEWRLAPAVAAMHGVSPLLAGGGSRDGPRAWSEFLEQQHGMTLARQQRLAGLLERIGELACRQGLAIVPLKGAALCALGVYAAGERPMADLDLLVASGDAEPAAHVLGSLGYRETGGNWKHRCFEPLGTAHLAALGEHVANPVKIDLHERVTERLPIAECEITDLVFPATAAPGLNSYPSRAALLLHVLVHAAGSMVHRGLRLLQLVDIARLAGGLSPADWRELVDWHGSKRRLWWIAAPLILAQRYLPFSPPPDTLVQLAGDCPALLLRVAWRRTLTDFSYSHVFIDPVPGIVWARSGTEMLRYLASRILPSAAQRAQLALLARTGPWAGEPGWYEQSQTRRILDWITSRPTRTETMQPVRAVLEQR